jgi:nitrite reductase/ring-hydroxylating ferredoxin subunit
VSTAIAPAEAVEDAPTIVECDGKRYILSRGEDGGPILYSAVCPHQRGRVRVAGEDRLLCPNHRWEFDALTGECLTVEDERLTERPVEKRDGTLYADLSG